MARDEGQMIRKWVEHYGRQLGYDRLLVIDDGSTDGSTDDLPCTVYRLSGGPSEFKFGRARTTMMSSMAAALLNWHEVAIWTDVDEFLVPDPERFDGLSDYLAATASKQVCAPVALNLLHVEQLEGPLDLTQPVIGQRRFAKFVPRMCKPSIKRLPAPWRQEGHSLSHPFRVDPDLYMFHLKWGDRDLLQDSAERRHAGFQIDGRGDRSSWQQSGESLAGMLKDFVGRGDPARAPEVDPRDLHLDKVVVDQGRDTWGPLPEQQVKSMRQQPLLRIPERFVGTV